MYVPRTTYDAHVVIEASLGSLDGFMQSLGDELYVDPETAKESRYGEKNTFRK